MSSFSSQQQQQHNNGPPPRPLLQTQLSSTSDSGADLDAEDKRWTEEGDIGRHLKHVNPSPPMLLGKFSVMCFIINRMIGSGIFSTPSTLMHLTQSVGITLLFWLAGACTTLCGALMFMEYGLTSPRFPIDNALHGGKIPVPRSGADLYYLKDVIKKPKFLAVCLYGIAFVFLGNIATNSMAFGVRVLQAAGREGSPDTWDGSAGWEARGIAVVVVTAICALHGAWRLGGIYLSNVFAITKLAMLLLVFITGCLSWGGVFPEKEAVGRDNLSGGKAFENPSSDAYAFASAYLSVVFAFGGFNQANYVLGEVRNPKKNYKWPSFIAVLVVCILYMLVNISYMLVVPASEQKDPEIDVATRFFEMTYGSLVSDGAQYAPRILHAFMAISAMGNLIVFTFAAARVKQEIAKEGILPFQDFFANNKVLFKQEDNPVPFGALVLHWGVSILFILATAKLPPLSAYRILVGLYSYTVDAIFGVILAIGIFVLRFRSGRSFAANSFLPTWISCLAALIYGASLAFPLITSWVPPSKEFVAHISSSTPWFTTATVSWCVVALGALWWVGFAKLYPMRHPGKQLVIRRTLFINNDLVMDHEILDFDWPPKEDDTDTLHEEARIEWVDQ